MGKCGLIVHQLFCKFDMANYSFAPEPTTNMFTHTHHQEKEHKLITGVSLLCLCKWAMLDYTEVLIQKNI